MISRTASKLVCSNGRTGKSFSVAALAASASKNESEIEISKANGSDEKLKKGKKIPRAQRRALVEEFVKKYRAMNDGKLPATSNVVKEVGGSYYVVKKLLQEVEFQLKMPAFNQSALGKETVNKEGHPSKSKVATKSDMASNSGIQSDTQVVVHNRPEIDNASGKDIEAERGSQASSSATNTSSKQVVSRGGYSEFSVDQSSQPGQKNITHLSCEKLDMGKAEDSASDIRMPTDLLKEKSESRAEGDALVFGSKENTLSGIDTNRVSHPGPDSVDGNKQKEAASEDLRNKDVSEGKTGQHGETPKHKHTADVSSRQTSEAEADKKPTLWGNLKSFADGIMKIWRKS